MLASSKHCGLVAQEEYNCRQKWSFKHCHSYQRDLLWLHYYILCLWLLELMMNR